MLRLSEFHGYSIHASDGHLGQVVDVFFDDVTWAVRYVVVQTGGWLHHRRALISLSPSHPF